MGIKYLLPCSCGETRPIELCQAGETVPCRCGAMLQVPTMRDIKKLEPYDQRSDDSSLRQVSTWGRRESRIFLGTLLTCTGLGLFGYTQMTRPKLADMGSLSPIQTWVLWQDLRNGPDRSLRPFDQRHMKRLAVNRLATVAALSLTCVGILAMVAASLMRKRRPVRRRP